MKKRRCKTQRRFFYIAFVSLLCYFKDVRIFKFKWFHRFSNKEDISDSELKEIVNQLEKGQYYADLGGGVYKMRLTRENQGKKRGKFRLIVIFKSEFRTFFAYGFPKAKIGNINKKDLLVYKEQAKDYFNFNEEQINASVREQSLIEIL